MSTPRLDRAAAILAEIRDVLDAADLGGVHVTLTPRDIARTVAAGVVVITPPDLTFPTHHMTDASWDIWAIAGPAQDIVTAWGKVDAILDALTTGLDDIAAARAESYQPAGDNIPPVPAYVLTLTETHTH